MEIRQECEKMGKENKEIREQPLYNKLVIDEYCLG